MTVYKQQLGGLLDTAAAASAIARDPYLPEVTSLVLKLQAMESDDDGPSSSGVGLRNVVKPLRLFVDVQEKPWIVPTVAIGVFGFVLLVGYYTGKSVR